MRSAFNAGPSAAPDGGRMASDSTTNDDRPIPRATYRLQFNAAFGFRDAAALAPYLSRLGVSHVYASPYLRARSGSSHGYDIVDHASLNPELGTAEDFAAMGAAFDAHGLKQILDFVPNHMGVGGADNPWWLDVLEWGANSTYSGWFDIDWQPESPSLDGRVLLPVLGEQYGAVLAAGGLRLVFDAAAGTFAVWAYGSHKMPVRPADYRRILGARHPLLARLGDGFAHLNDWHPHQERRAGELKAELVAAARDPEVAGAIDAAVDRFTGREGDLESWSRLDALIRQQHWRPAHFRVAADEINYRRFFNISDLAGIRMEHEELFDHAHALVFDLVAKGVLDGIRIDHIDGLFDPKDYCLRLRRKAPRPIYLVVEKILAPHERLRSDWGTDGTTGYEFANLVTGLLTSPAGEPALDDFHSTFTGDDTPFASVVEACKRRIIADEMASELAVLARDAARIAVADPRSADFTTNLLRRAIAEVVIAFPVYRTYVDGSAPTATDRRDIDWAFSKARRAEPSLDGSVFDFLYGLATTDVLAEPGFGYSRHEVVRFAMRLQQYCGPVMAKGLEDTAFYRYNRFLAANEVGGHPEHLGVSVAAFHEANLRRARETPHAMLSTSTHDTKRGEDTRARLALLAELAEEWTALVPMWSRLLRAREAGAEQGPPDASDEYAFYQLVIGAWPPELGVDDVAGMTEFRDRLHAAMVKTMREAKRATSWASPDAAYEDAVNAFVGRALDNARTNPFLESARAFVRRLHPLGAQNSLVQTTLKLTLPGVPDIYRGAELWDFSLVDPDNRRPVDFAARERLIGALDPGAPPLGDASAIEDGRAKLALTAALLRLRTANPELFRDGRYEVAATAGDDGEQVIAFLRRHAGNAVLVAVRRFPSRPLPPEVTCAVPPATAGWRDLATGATLEAEAGGLAIGRLLAAHPVAVLSAELEPGGAA